MKSGNLHIGRNVKGSIEKSFGKKDTSKLTKKTITNKSGKQQTVYVKGDAVTFDHKGKTYEGTHTGKNNGVYHNIKTDVGEVLVNENILKKKPKENYKKVNVLKFEHTSQPMHPEASRTLTVHGNHYDDDKKAEKFDKIVKKHMGKHPDYKKIESDYTLYGAVHNFAIDKPEQAKKMNDELESAFKKKKIEKGIDENQLAKLKPQKVRFTNLVVGRNHKQDIFKSFK